MSFQLTSDITVGQYKRVKVNEAVIKRSMLRFVDTATFKIPISAVVRRAGVSDTESADTAKLITEGMPVEISLGYNGFAWPEFQGFVTRVNPVTPTEIECEGYSYQLRQKIYVKSWRNVELFDVLQFLVEKTDIVLDRANVVRFKIARLLLNGVNGLEALEKIKKASADALSFYFSCKVLHAVPIGTDKKELIRYRIGWNVIKDNQLKLRQATNQDSNVKVIAKEKDGKKYEAVAGSRNNAQGGEVLIVTKAITDQESADIVAKGKKRQLSYNGYEGKITAFLRPYCEPGWVCELQDTHYPDRGGRYLVESTEVKWGRSGARRILDIGLKVS